MRSGSNEVRRSVQTEMRTIEVMVRIYCRSRHGRDLCEECGNILTHCFARIEKCVFGPDKPVCNICTVHCYSTKMREKVKTIMRFSGPKMIYRHPYLTIVHLVKKKRKKLLSLTDF